MTQKRKPGTTAKRGRKPKYKKEMVAQAEKLCGLLGATDREVAEFFEITERTLNRWKQQHPELCQALKVGKDGPDDRVEMSLYRRATGYSFDAVKIFQYEGVPVSVPYTEHVPPDTTACIFWLKNRRKESWRDKIDHTLSGEDGGPVVYALDTGIRREPDPAS